MNRTLPTQTGSNVVPSSNSTNWVDRLELGFPEIEAPTASSYRCFAPINYERGYAYPLIVWLHGSCSNEDELPEVMPLISTRNYVAVAPRGTRHFKDIRGAYTWQDSHAGISQAIERVEECVELAQERFNVREDRVFIAGHCSGGTMAHRLALEYPERFAGAISLGGRVPRGSHLLKHFDRVRTLPLLLSVSPSEENYEIDEVMNDLQFLHLAGLSVSLRLYPEGDELTTVMLSDLNSWVMEVISGAGAPVSN